MDHVEVPTYDGGPDPLPWKQFIKNAKKYGWQQEDWQHLFEEESLSDEEHSVDEDWFLTTKSLPMMIGT